jgi:4-hydroxy-4-methyl-2-oxoglutarate aldolase
MLTDARPATQQNTDLLGRLARLEVANVCDAQASFGAPHPSIHAIVPGLRAVGPAHTVKCYPGSIITVHKALLEAAPGEVIVVDGEGDERGALFGELMALQAQANGIAGIVIDGPVRDRAALLGIGLPVFATGINPRVGSNRRVGQTQVPVQCGGVVVQPGDYVLADDAGVVIVPATQLVAAVEATEAVAAKEARIRTAIAHGEQLGDLLGFRALIYGA